jgi:hypothetical protein
MKAHHGLAMAIGEMESFLSTIQETVEEIEEFLDQLRELDDEEQEEEEEEEVNDDTMHEISRIINGKTEGIEVGFDDVIRSMEEAVNFIEKVAPGTIVGVEEFLECCTCDIGHRHMRSASDIDEYIDRTEVDLTSVNNCLHEWKDVIVHIELDVVIDLEHAIDRIVE